MSKWTPSNGYFSWMFKKHLWSSFFPVSGGWNSATCTWNKQFPKSVLKNFSKVTGKHKKQSSGGVLSKVVLNKFTKFTEKHLCWSLFFNKNAGWKPDTVRSNHWRCSVKQSVHKNFANFTGENLCWILFLIKLQFWGPATLLKKTPTQVLSCEFCKLFKRKTSVNVCL